MTEGLPYLASVMFDAQKYPLDQNIALTKKYVEEHGKNIMVEGIMEELSVEGNSVGKGDDSYIDKALNCLDQTGVDFLVADLRTEQQSTSSGRCEYRKDRAELASSIGNLRKVCLSYMALSAWQKNR